MLYQKYQDQGAYVILTFFVHVTIAMGNIVLFLDLLESYLLFIHCRPNFEGTFEGPFYFNNLAQLFLHVA